MQKDLSPVRHSLAHLLATAVLKKYPKTLLAIGPAIEHGFYYDFLFPKGVSIGPEDLKEFEKDMRSLAKKKLSFLRSAVSVADAKKIFKGQPFKLELIEEFAGDGKELTLYTTGDFVDLCRGGHVENTSEIAPDGFALTHVAGAYWRGSEKNPQLTRIYGLAFENKDVLAAHIAMIEEAKKRDHRKLGKELELFTIIDEIGAGLPLFYPKGAILRRLVENFIIEEQEKNGYVPIWIPHITKGELYKISGHLDKYDAMYNPMEVDKDNYYLKPMNCPHFMMLYKTLPHSYRELPLRYTATTTNYRYEKSGELSGLTRVRALTQDDCHVFCRPEQIEKEIERMVMMIERVYRVFGFNDFWVRISLRDPRDKKKYIGTDGVWNKAEDALRNAVKKTGWKSAEVEGEAAFYGPKLDFIMKDVLGREWQLSTIQLDFNLPERFELEYTDEKSEKARPVVIHRAILGSTERFLAILIEHYGGAFPLWLSPVQVAILPVGESHKTYAHELSQVLIENSFRPEVRDQDETLGKKIREAKLQKAPAILVLGDKEKESGMLTLEYRSGEKFSGNISEILERLKKDTLEKK